MGDKSIELSVHIQPGLKPNVIAIALGYEVYAGAVGSDVGKNAFLLVTRGAAGAAQLSGLKVEISKTSKTYSEQRRKEILSFKGGIRTFFSARLWLSF